LLIRGRIGSADHGDDSVKRQQSNGFRLYQFGVATIVGVPHYHLPPEHAPIARESDFNGQRGTVPDVLTAFLFRAA
jgi:hypothetical protein